MRHVEYNVSAECREGAYRDTVPGLCRVTLRISHRLEPCLHTRITAMLQLVAGKYTPQSERNWESTSSLSC